MKIKFGVWWLSTALALVGSTMTPAMADEWNKETRLEVKVPVEIPGKVLTPGTYIFKLANDEADRNIVEVFSEDAGGKQKLVTIILAIPAYRLETPDKPIIRLEERASGQPEAIRSWFYPGDNAGWEFVYPKSERLEVALNQAPAEQSAVTPLLPDPPVEAAPPESVVEVKVVEQASVVEDETPAPVPNPSEDLPSSADRLLPETAGHSVSQLIAGIAMLSLGLLTVSVGLRRKEA